MNETQQVQFDTDQFALLGTILSGVLPADQAIEAANLTLEAGGLELFDADWSCELWRRAEAALKAKRPPNDFLHVKQVSDVPLSIITRLMGDPVPLGLMEQVYLPDLMAFAEERKMRRAIKDAAEGGSIEKAMEVCQATKAVALKKQTKDQICNEILTEWEKAAENPGELTGITSGLKDLDRMTGGWQRENLIIVGARPSQGKTALLLSMARATALEGRIPTLFITLESSPKELMKRLACQEAMANQTRLRDGQPTERDLAGLVPAFKKIRNSPLWFSDCSGMSIVGIQAAARNIIKNYGIKLVIVDYLQKIKPAERHEKRTYEVAQASEGLKVLAKDMKLPVIAAAQLNREPEKQKGRRPFLSDLADSGQIERDADIVALLHKDKDGNELIVSKFRDGPTGMVRLYFNLPYGRFENAAKIDREDTSPHNDP